VGHQFTEASRKTSTRRPGAISHSALVPLSQPSLNISLTSVLMLELVSRTVKPNEFNLTPPMTLQSTSSKVAEIDGY